VLHLCLGLCRLSDGPTAWKLSDCACLHIHLCLLKGTCRSAEGEFVTAIGGYVWYRVGGYVQVLQLHASEVVVVVAAAVAVSPQVHGFLKL
jgi:hypothetical protein